MWLSLFWLLFFPCLGFYAVLGLNIRFSSCVLSNWCCLVCCGALLGWVGWARQTKEASEKPGLCRRGHKHQQPATTSTITQENQGGKREAIHVISPLFRSKNYNLEAVCPQFGSE